MITLVLGGARSGKSAVAERLATRLPPPVTYVATAVLDVAVTDPQMSDRIAAHRARRAAGWLTVEVGETLAESLGALPGSVLVDALGTWVARCPDFAVDPGALCVALSQRRGDSVLVSDEVGMGVHPGSAVGRHFRDVLGQVNQAVAEIADDVLLVVAGRTLRLDRSR